MRIVVVSDRHLSGEALAGALRHIPGTVMVAWVDGLDTARRYCDTGEADVLMIDASVIDDAPPDLITLLDLTADKGLTLHCGAGPADPLTERIRRPWHVTDATVRRLTSREHAVFILLGLGLSNRHMADRLGVTERTVKARVGQIMRKLDLDSRLQLGLASFVYLARNGG